MQRMDLNHEVGDLNLQTVGQRFDDNIVLIERLIRSNGMNCCANSTGYETFMAM